ncbi:dehydrogenase [Gluconacetobacter johannae DSM 13595]|uniref:Protein FixC n=1 Tax=Gluconacetobacter johannae TaxID=112140 RepID=A0A7W4J6M1_9PROT|nr:FAD-dependent oxidoreductase [Gluconacetobacter johannae]MBB2175629.1 FAD-dependent oxidoreductase [Gluconacetobacter johannae]GBQ86065.1 dehydrogenase [Gluconacetobacter johannae DSM 13595]
MKQNHFDAIVVGAGPSGNAAAYTLAQRGLNVLQIERGEYAGSKNVQGAILYADALEKIIPDFRDEAPLERHIVEQRVWMMDDAGHTGMHHRSDDYNEDKPNRYTILRAQFDKWFSRCVKEAGATVIYETTVTSLMRDASGWVVGVHTDRNGEGITADVVILAEGVNGLVGRTSGLREELKPENVALAVKEMHFLPQEVIDARFNLKGNEGVVIEAMGTITEGMVGTAFLYTNRESISVGIGCMVSDFTDVGQATPHGLLDRFKAHPSIRALLEGSEIKEYAAHLIPEGGYRAIPELVGNGWLVVGDAGHFVNAVHREGSNLAMTTGRLAAETVADIILSGGSCSRHNLAAYVEAVKDSFVMKDMKKYKDIHGFLKKGRHVVDLYPRLMNRAAQTWFRVDGVDKKSKESTIVREAWRARGIGGLMGDAFKLMRAWR